MWTGKERKTKDLNFLISLSSSIFFFLISFFIIASFGIHQEIQCLPPEVFLMNKKDEWSCASHSSLFKTYNMKGPRKQIEKRLKHKCEVCGILVHGVKTNTLTHGCLKVQVECLSFYACLLILYSQGSFAWSLENVW